MLTLTSEDDTGGGLIPRHTGDAVEDNYVGFRKLGQGEIELKPVQWIRHWRYVRNIVRTRP